MTTQESFKKRIRARMAKTGERYSAARRSLLNQSTPQSKTTGWVSEPAASDSAVRKHTGRGWDEWVQMIEAGPGRDSGHTAIAAWVHEEHGVDGWWAQSVTVGYERITGLRLPGQMPDGTFTVSRSRSLDLNPEEFRQALLEDDVRAELLAGLSSTLRSKPTTKAPRFSLSDADSGDELGILQLRVDTYGNRPKLVVTHEKLPTPEAGEIWKEYWSGWLKDLTAETGESTTP